MYGHDVRAEWLKMWPGPGWFWFWFACYKAGWFLIDLGIEFQPLSGVEHPWLDAISENLQTVGARLRDLAKASLILGRR